MIERTSTVPTAAAAVPIAEAEGAAGTVAKGARVSMGLAAAAAVGARSTGVVAAAA